MLKKLKLRLAMIIFIILTLLLTGVVSAISVFMIRSLINQSTGALDLTLQNDGERGHNPFFFDNGSAPAEPADLSARDGLPSGNIKGETPSFGLDTIAFKYGADGAIFETLSQSSDTDEITDSQSSAISALISGEEDGGIVEIDGVSYRWKKESRSYGGIIALVGRQIEISMTRRILSVSIPALLFGTMVFAVVSLLLSSWAARPVEEAWNRQKRFVADASHELKTPLTVISTNLELVMENGSETVDSQKKWLGYIGAEADRMKVLVGDLLVLARYDAGITDSIVKSGKSVAPPLPAVNLSDTVTDACLTFESTFYEAGQTLECDIEDGMTMRGSEQQLRRLTVILLDNAVKNTYRGGRVSVRLHRVRNEIRLECENTGRGLSEEECGKVFERFWRADDSRTRAGVTENSGGYGLGLSIALSIVESHGGKIKASGAPGEFALFSVTFPANQA